MKNRILDRVSYHAVYDGAILEAMRYGKANGFAGAQIADETPHLSSERLSDEDVSEIAHYTDSEGVYVTLQSPIR